MLNIVVVVSAMVQVVIFSGAQRNFKYNLVQCLGCSSVDTHGGDIYAHSELHSSPLLRFLTLISLLANDIKYFLYVY